MKATSGISLNNAAVAATPKHLLQFAVDQRYDDYTPVDHAVWRFIMRQNTFFLKEYAHKVYFQGLLDTGISFERIPRIQEMNDILAKIEWGAVAVDGFIPPAAFMEFQAYKVLVIACDMRQIHHIEYTPAPDIVHEAAGHAPIIVDREYSKYLQRFGEVGAKAMSSKRDFELYQAIRHLSILKEQPNGDPKEIEEATKLVEHRQKTLGEPSEMALLSRLHWWTVEYGLIGTLENPKIYGAGLLSSIGESVSCLEPHVKKIPYSVDAMNQPFDITTKQPQLFVCRDFQHLKDVLEEFASKMAYQVGGLEGINKAIECNNVATCEYSSGLQVSGVFSEVITDERNSPIYLRTTGKSALAFGNKELPGHGIDYHKEGFGSPIGKWKETKLAEGQKAKLEFEIGITVEGKVEKILHADELGSASRAAGQRGVPTILISFSNCRAKYGDRVLFDPDWGIYDMAVGERISSVFNGAADKDAYNQVALVPKERTIKVPSDAKRKKLENLYAQVRKIRESKTGYERLGEIWETQQAEHPSDWLLSMEIFEILDTTDQQSQLKARIEKFLNQKKATTKDLSTLIGWGFRLVEYHKRPEYQAALHVSPK
ncbi:MAG TPA: aromatic amino acid hydroxylase [Chthoniobacterales bacterium]|jgi:phenylalanine-4-hydroxylase|nr:aromatic amino acid hydroxylase [Chthoniobacterales bacterium]